MLRRKIPNVGLKTSDWCILSGVISQPPALTGTIFHRSVCVYWLVPTVVICCLERTVMKDLVYHLNVNVQQACHDFSCTL